MESRLVSSGLPHRIELKHLARPPGIKGTMNQRLTTLLILLAVVPAAAQNTSRPAPSDSPVTAVHPDAAGVTFALQKGTLRLAVCDAHTIHVSYAPGNSIPPITELVVIKKWDPIPFKVDDKPAAVTISTDALSARVDRQSGAVSFLDAAGKTLLAEPDGGGRKMTPTLINREQAYTVEQSFVCPADEHLYGMAEGQDGTWNWRGMPIELRQQNTQAALPMLISSRGYGLMWDNASLTDFNPVDDEVPLQLQTPPATEDASAPKSTEQLQASKKKGPRPITIRHGTFTSGEAGEYVFFAKDGNRSAEFSISIDGQIIAELKNMWVPYTITGRTRLPANKTVQVTVRGGGANVRLYARPLGNTTTFRSEIGDLIDYFFIYGPSLDRVIAEYRDATGAAPMWPKWAFGFWQCRERYSSQQQILDAIAEFRKERIPIDLLVQDWQWWTGGWSSYLWDKKHYPDPAAMIKALHDQHVHFMISVWSNPAGPTDAELKAHHATLGNTSWFDAFNPIARDIRWKHINDTVFSIGTDAWWQDATEPGDDGNAMETNATVIGAGCRYRNAYPLFAQQSIYDGQRAADPSKRVCILTRSSYLGEQRYAAALWSGDIRGDWPTFRRQIAAGLNVCLTGLPYWTTDCAGFFRPPHQYENADYNELLERWFQFSTFCPVLRVHGYQTETEMWKWPLAKDVLLKYDRLRYRLLPYNYSVSWQVTHAGYTMMRALPMDFASDTQALNIADEYMFGPAFLVSPVTEPSATTRSIYLPAGTTWTDFWTGESTDGGRIIQAPAPRDTLPLMIRAGSILPIGPAMQYADEKKADPIELRIYPGADGHFDLYEDEGDNYNYEKGTYAIITLTWNDKTKTLTIGQRQGTFPGMLQSRSFHVVLVGKGHGIGDGDTEKADNVVSYSGDAVAVSPR
jgi:alpha-D-xyloside xylohydrolase